MMAKQIRLMRDAVIACKCYNMEKFDSTPDFMIPADKDEDVEEGEVPILKEWDGSIECSCLVVKDDEFFWSGIFRHTEVRYETEAIQMKEIRWL